MSASKITTISMTDLVKEEGKRLSVDFYGRENLSGFISILIRDASDKATKKAALDEAGELPK